MKAELPKVNQIYNCFDDGKINHSRLYTVNVKEVVSFNKIDNITLKEWKEEVKQCYWLYAEETDYFIKTENGEDGDAVFVRTKDGGWFSIGEFMNRGLTIKSSISQSKR